MLKKIKIKKLLIILFLFLISFTIFLIWQNNDIMISEYEYNNIKIPEEFSNFKILQISDLHNKEFGKDQKRLVNKIKDISPDIIVVTGDLIDSYHPKVEVSREFIKEVIKISPIYYVSGNHEYRLGRYEELKRELMSFGVNVLDNKNVKIEKNGEYINIIGVLDISFLNENYQIFHEKIESLYDEDSFNLLLSHRPDLLEIYTNSKMDLVLSGHAHGGQIRLPFIGGLVAPNQGLFPKYTSGEYRDGNTTMIVSRGLGNSIFPFRIFNRPELVIIYLNK